MRGQEALDLGVFPMAIEAFGEAGDIDPSFALAWYWRAVALGWDGSLADQILAIERAAAFRGRLPDDISRGAEMFERQPDVSRWRYDLVRLTARAGDLDTAREQLQVLEGFAVRGWNSMDLLYRDAAAASEAWRELVGSGYDRVAYPSIWVPALHALGVAEMHLGAIDEGRAHLQLFLRYWADADVDLPLIADAETRLATN